MEAALDTKVIYRVAAALLGLLALTAGASFLPLGPFGFPVALTIAAAKALLVILFFMEVRYSSHLIWIMAGVGFVWLAILLGGTLSDYFTRLTVYLPLR